MTYIVSSGTLNPTIPYYYTIPYKGEEGSERGEMWWRGLGHLPEKSVFVTKIISMVAFTLLC